jgi:hypothetical protein
LFSLVLLWGILLARLHHLGFSLLFSLVLLWGILLARWPHLGFSFLLDVSLCSILFSLVLFLGILLSMAWLGFSLIAEVDVNKLAYKFCVMGC